MSTPTHFAPANIPRPELTLLMGKPQRSNLDGNSQAQVVETCLRKALLRRGTRPLLVPALHMRSLNSYVHIPRHPSAIG